MHFDWLFSTLNFLIIIGILVLAHEGGHFFAAKMCKMRVDEFALGMGPVAARLGTRNETVFNIRWFPIGGFVKIAGMMPDDEPILGSYNTKPLWQRAWVVFAGPLASLVFGYFLFVVLCMTSGVPNPDLALPIVSDVMSRTPAEKAGLKSGDKIVSVNGKQVNGDWKVVHDTINEQVGKPITVVVERDKEQKTLTLIAAAKNELGSDAASDKLIGFEPDDIIIQVDSNSVKNFDEIKRALTLADKNVTLTAVRLIKGSKADPQRIISIVDPKLVLSLSEKLFTHGMIGITPEFQKERFSPLQAISKGSQITYNMISQIFSSFASRVKLSENIGGPVAIGAMTHEATQKGFSTLVLLAASLSISLGIMNLLPIPILDGGHLLVCLIELLRGGKKLSAKALINIQYVGLAMILIIVFAVMTKDVGNIIHQRGP